MHDKIAFKSEKQEKKLKYLCGNSNIKTKNNTSL